MKQFLGQLSYALKRVTTEFQAAENALGEHDFDLEIVLYGLSQDESERMIRRFISNERVQELSPFDRAPVDNRRCFISMRVERVADPTAATVVGLEAIRQALYEEKLASKVTDLEISVSE